MRIDSCTKANKDLGDDDIKVIDVL